VKHRERLRHLIEPGGLVTKAGFVELTDDDRAILFGLIIKGATTFRSEQRNLALTLWRGRGTRVFALADGTDKWV
jgi:hypothetical protein